MYKVHVRRPWDTFTTKSRSHNVPDKAIRWYVIRIEQHLKTHPVVPLTDHTSDILDHYLKELGRQHGVKDC